jgi:hypothetical protein
VTSPVRVYGRNFGRVPDELLWDTGASDAACRLYAALTRYGQRGDRIVPPRKELAKRLGWSTSKLDRYREELERIGALYVEHCFDPKTRRQEESAYWIDGRRPLPKSDKGSLPTDDEGSLPKSGKDAVPKSGEPIEQRESSAPNGAGAKAPASSSNGTSGNPQTSLAALIDHVRERTGNPAYRPDDTTIGKLTKAFERCYAAGATAAEVDAAARAWAAEDRDASLLPSFVDARRRGGQRNGQPGHVTPPRSHVGHDGRHDPACWCYSPTGGTGAPPLLEAAGIARRTPVPAGVDNVAADG